MANNEKAEDALVYQNYEINAKLDDKGVTLSDNIIKNLNILDIGETKNLRELKRLKGLKLKGIYTDSDGGKYEGEWFEGKRHGKGTMTYESGDKYEGEWFKDEYHGKGTLIWANGSTETRLYYGSGHYKIL